VIGGEEMSMSTSKKTVDEKHKEAKKQWVQKMIRSAKLHHKVCPFYDRKKKFCFIKLGERCPYDGKFDNCSVFVEFLEKRYDEIVESGKPLPIDFEDPLVQFGVT